MNDIMINGVNIQGVSPRTRLFVFLFKEGLYFETSGLSQKLDKFLESWAERVEVDYMSSYYLRD